MVCIGRGIKHDYWGLALWPSYTHEKQRIQQQMSESYSEPTRRKPRFPIRHKWAMCIYLNHTHSVGYIQSFMIKINKGNEHHKVSLKIFPVLLVSGELTPYLSVHPFRASQASVTFISSTVCATTIVYFVRKVFHYFTANQSQLSYQKWFFSLWN